MLGFLCKHVLHHSCKPDGLAFTAHLSSRAGALFSLFVEHSVLSAAHTLATVGGDPSLLAVATSSLRLVKAADAMSRADVSLDSLLIDSIRDRFLSSTWALSLAVGSNESYIALADSGGKLSSGLDEALSIATADLALEHWAGHMASLARKWLLAFTASA